MLADSLLPKSGGLILAHGLTQEVLQVRVAEDPLVVGDVVRPEVMELSVAKSHPRLAFLNS